MHSAKPKSLELTTAKMKQGTTQFIDCEHAFVQPKDELFLIKNLEKVQAGTRFKT